MPHDDFEQLEEARIAGGVAAVLDRLADRLRAQQKYHELFEALKMRLRHRLGLPLLYGDSGDELAEPQRRELEDGLLAACREVGLGLLRAGQIREGWMYLRAVGERESVADELARLPVDEQNLEALLEVSLHEGVDPHRGFALVLEHYGTCNAITTFESVMPRQRPPDQQAAAALLLEHLHGELLRNVRAHIAQQEGSEPPALWLRELCAERPWLFGQHSYHIDTTHLASVVRFARLLRQPEQLRLALDLTDYGGRLSSQFQYPGDEPFREFYPSHRLFFAAQLGELIDEAVPYFRHKAETVDTAQHGSVAIEVYVDLLARMGRSVEALEQSIQLMPAGQRPLGWGPSLLELAEQSGDFERLTHYCRQQGDLLGFAMGLVQAGKRR